MNILLGFLSGRKHLPKSIDPDEVQRIYDNINELYNNPGADYPESAHLCDDEDARQFLKSIFDLGYRAGVLDAEKELTKYLMRGC